MLAEDEARELSGTEESVSRSVRGGLTGSHANQKEWGAGEGMWMLGDFDQSSLHKQNERSTPLPPPEKKGEKA